MFGHPSLDPSVWNISRLLYNSKRFIQACLKRKEVGLKRGELEREGLEREELEGEGFEGDGEMEGVTHNIQLTQKN